LSQILGEEHRVRFLESRMMRRISGPDRDERIGRRKFHDEELHNFDTSSNIIRMM
jgi:hypothetical protein